MSNIPTYLQYTRSHEWVRRLQTGQVEIGVTDHAQSALGDLVYVEVPDVGVSVSSGAACAVVESVKAASDVYCPVSGKVIANNTELATQPELVNQDPYGAGWLLRVELDASGPTKDLLTATEYAQFLADAK